MSLLCRFLGHRRASRVSGHTGDLRSNCTRCGANLVRYGHRDWRGVDVDRPRFSLRHVAWTRWRSAQCRFGHHKAVRSYSRWVNDDHGRGYHVSRCAHCDVTLRRAGGRWQPLLEEEAG
jgi:hypothetical protein